MNSIIKSQLRSCKVADVPQFEDTTTMIHIPKGSTQSVSPYQVGKCYIVELSDSVLNPSQDSILSTNWNNGTVPRYKYYKCEISAVLGKMVKIIGYGYDLQQNNDMPDMWEGWIPQQSIRIIQSLA